MNIDTAMDIETNVTTAEAMYELEKHGFTTFVMNDELYAGNDPDYERVCIVYKGMVKSRTLLLWLGY